jgi:sporulation protein YlmC with PRC-barrel domain
MLKGKKVDSNDGKDVGEIKEVSQDFLRLEK